MLWMGVRMTLCELVELEHVTDSESEPSEAEDLCEEQTDWCDMFWGAKFGQFALLNALLLIALVSV